MNRLYAFLYFVGGSLFFAFFSPVSASAQDKCGTVKYEQMIHPPSPKLDKEEQFEKWIKDKISGNKLGNFGVQRIEATSYTIPVVVHVIHNGEAVGTGTNISDAQILSQIDVINADYKRLNSDASNTPSEFLPVAGSIDITFVLAKQDPEGLASASGITGITRTKGTKTSWTLDDNNEFKALSYWPAENYLNIWVIDFSSQSQLVGYAQLPTIDAASTMVYGLEDSSTDRLTDGVAIDYQAFGSGTGFNLTTQFNKGRTATHEIGHFFGLRHIWGDGNCATDYVDDTPAQTTNTSGCPSHPQASCDVAAKPNKMFQNYMDYTNDLCMNLFTNEQVIRMSKVLGNSPRRVSLLSSPGAFDPVPVPDDLGIRTVVAPLPSTCTFPVIPKIEVRNYGSNSITSATIQLSINGTPQTPIPFTLNLSPQQLTTLFFNQLNFIPNSSQQISFAILQTNGNTDGKSENNSASVQVTVPSSTSLPISEPFNSIPTGWQIVNPDGSITWTNVVAPDDNPANKAMYMHLHDYENQGTLDWLITPAFTISNPLTSQLKFDLAYAQYPGVTADELKIYAFPDCNRDLTTAILLYDSTSTALFTAPSTSTDFTPTSNAQWKKPEVVSLINLIGATNWQLGFVAKNGFGNNLYIDNTIVSDQVINDLAIINIVSPGLVHCVQSPTIQFTLRNLGTQLITEFQVSRILNGGAAVIQNFKSISIVPGEQKQFQLNATPLLTGNNEITLTISLLNNLFDLFPTNNIITFKTYLDKSSDSSPLKMTFDSSAEIPWLIATPLAGQQPWQTVTTTKKQSLVYRAYNNTNIGQESWVVSPVIDLSRYSTNSFFFDLSYGQRTPTEDRLKVLASTDCGLTYKVVLMDQPGSEFKTTTSSNEWVPTLATDWKTQFINLDTISGKQNVRLAVVATNEHGNNIYVDNLQIFQGDDPRPVVPDQPYTLYYSTRNTQSDLALSFNLPEKSDVRLQIYSVMGQVISDKILPETLNQTYYFDFGIYSAGIYLFRLQIDDQVSTTKVFIGH